MPRLSHLIMSFKPATGHATLPLPRMTMLQVLSIQGVTRYPSLSCLRLIRLELTSQPLSGPPLHQASADVPQRLKVCHASPTLLLVLRWLCPTTLLFKCRKVLSQLRCLDLSWDSPEPVRFGETLMGLKQLETMHLVLPDFSGLEQLPPNVTCLTLHASKHLDMAAAPCLWRSSSLRILMLQANKGGTDML